MKKVLLIEDHYDMRENICEMLELKGYEVISACNGLDGVEMAKKHMPDIILCDIRMPLADGHTVLKNVKKDVNLSSTPFIFLTANTQKDDVEEGLRLGANAYMKKPFSSDELFNTITRCLKG